MNAIFKEDLSQKQLNDLFENEEKCLEFIAELKWTNGFVCRKCGNTNSCPGKSHFSKRCTKCKTEESATAGTMFHNCKFPLNKAFYMAYNVCKGLEDISTYEFARRLALRQMTCWKFKDKVKKAIEAMGEKPENWTDLFK